MCKANMALFDDVKIYDESNAYQILGLIDSKYRDGNAIETVIKAGGYKRIEVYGDKSFVIIYSDPTEAGAALLYLRVSGDTQGKTGFGLDRQYNKIIQHIEEYNARLEKYANLEDYADEYQDKFSLHVAAVCFDVGISGDNRKDIIDIIASQKCIPLVDYFKNIRPALHYVLKHLRPTNRIVVESVDRLWREFGTTACNIQQIIAAANSDIIVQQNWSYTLWETEPMQYFVNMMTSCLADFDKKNIVNKLAASKVQAVIKGRDMSGCPHFGYDKNPDKTLKINETQAKIIREEIIDKLRIGWKPRHILSNLNEKGIKNVYGGEWRKRDLYQVFKRSRLIYGILDYGEIHAYHEHLKIVDADDYLKSLWLPEFRNDDECSYVKNDECCA